MPESTALVLAVAFNCALVPEVTDFPPEIAPLLADPLGVGTAVVEDAMITVKLREFGLGRSGVSRVKRLETTTSAGQAQQKRREFGFCSQRGLC